MQREFTLRHARFYVVAVALLQVLWLVGNLQAESSFRLLSPDQRIELNISTGDHILYSVSFKGKLLLRDCSLSLKVDETTLGVEPRIKASKERSVNQEIEPVVHQKFARIRENYNELRLEMEGNYAVVFRAYNEGVAYRLETSLPQAEVKVTDEEVRLQFCRGLSVLLSEGGELLFAQRTGVRELCAI